MDYEIKIVYVKIAKSYSAKKQFIKSESWLKKALQDIRAIKNIKFERELYSEFEDLYQKQIMYEQALYYAKKKNALDAIIKKNQIQDKLSALSAKNDNVEREKKIELLGVGVLEGIWGDTTRRKAQKGSQTDNLK